LIKKDQKMDGLFAKVAAGATVITPTSRLASYLVARFNAHMLNTGQEVWRSPEIFQLSVWLHSLWQSRGEDWPELTQTVYLGDQRERLLWEKVIGEELRSRDSGIELLWDLSATARMAQKSWGLLNDWNLTLQDFPDYLNQDCAAFSSWAVHYDTVLHQKTGSIRQVFRWLSSGIWPDFRKLLSSPDLSLSTPSKNVDRGDGRAGS
jgi:hypothetical protein